MFVCQPDVRNCSSMNLQNDTCLKIVPLVSTEQEKKSGHTGGKTPQNQPANKTVSELLSSGMQAKLAIRFNNFQHLFRSCIISLGESIN